MGVARHLSGHVGVARHLSGHVGVACHLSGHVGVARHRSGHVGVARHLSGQTLKAGLRLSHTDGQRTWTATGHLIVPALSRRRACREGSTTRYVGYITNVVNVTSLTNVIAISCICISLCKR